jgi:uncharacterized lipoprotein YddW (UPF0748 family)
MKSRFFLILFLLFAVPLNAQQIRHIYMWMDCEANYARLSSADSVRYYIDKMKDAGVTDVVLDVKSIMGTVVFKSNIAPYMESWVSGTRRTPDYDLVALVIKEGHKAGMGVYASMNIFAGGHNYFRSGILFAGEGNRKIRNEAMSAEGGPSAVNISSWQSQVYWRDVIFPITEMYWNYNAMLNPADPQVQKYEISIIKEFVGKYKALDGIIFDRMRYDDITSDFSVTSRENFEKYIGRSVKNWPQDIYTFKGFGGRVNYLPECYTKDCIAGTSKDYNEMLGFSCGDAVADSVNKYVSFGRVGIAAGDVGKSDVHSRVKMIMSRGRADSLYNADKQNIVPGPLYAKWLEWRAHVIKEFLSRARKDVKEINPDLKVGVYTGAWYGSYYNVGVNWASEKYIPKYPWATAKYGKQGYAELLDVYMSGFYYENISDGNIRMVKDVLRGTVPLTGSICVSIYRGNVSGFTSNMNVLLGRGAGSASSASSASSAGSAGDVVTGDGCEGGVMIFDLSHIVHYGWWKPLKKVLSNR